MEALLAFLKLDILIFLVHLEYVEAAKLVSRNKGISTRRGQMVHLPETEPRLDVPKEIESHKVDVVLNELVTLTVEKGRNASGVIVLWGVEPPWSSWPWEISPPRRDVLQWDGEELVEGFFQASSICTNCFTVMLRADAVFLFISLKGSF